MNRRLLMALPLLMFLLSGSGCGSRFPQSTVEFEGREYQRFGLADIPGADLRPVGTATLTEVDDVTDRTVLALNDVDPTVLIVLRIDTSKVEPDEDGQPPRSHALLGGPEVDRLPEVACRYFDPRAEASPTECQVPITVVFDGRRYRAFEAFVAKAGPAGLRFLPTDLTQGGPLSDIDPRLGKVDGAGHVIDHVDSTEAIVVVRGTGEDAEYLPFIAEALAEAPRSLCRFRDADGELDTIEPAPSDCPGPGG